MGPLKCPSSMNINDLYDSIILTENLAKDHYTQLNSIVDYNATGVCNHYFAKYDLQGQRDGEIVLTCKLSKTVKGQFRYTYQINGKRIAKKLIVSEFLMLGGFN